MDGHSYERHVFIYIHFTYYYNIYYIHIFNIFVYIESFAITSLVDYMQFSPTQKCYIILNRPIMPPYKTIFVYYLNAHEICEIIGS